MKLTDLIDALAGEIENVQPQLNSNLDDLQNLSLEDPAFMDALDQYSGQVQRMGEAVELAGFTGLQAVCGHVLESTLLLATQMPEERAPSIEFLRAWSSLTVQYLRNIEDPASAENLINAFENAPHPMDGGLAHETLHQLTSMPDQVSIMGEEEEKRAETALPEDVALEVPEDVEPQLMEGFFQEAPTQAGELVQLVLQMAEGNATTEDLSAAKRVSHTLKGSGAIIGLRGLASLGHHFEDVLEYFEKQGGDVAKPVAEVLIDAAYCLEQMVAFVTGTDEYPAQAQPVLQSVLDLANRIDRGEDLDAPAFAEDDIIADSVIGAEAATFEEAAFEEAAFADEATVDDAADITVTAESAGTVPEITPETAPETTFESAAEHTPESTPAASDEVVIPAPVAEAPAAVAPEFTDEPAPSAPKIKQKLTPIKPKAAAKKAQAAPTAAKSGAALRVSMDRVEELFRVSAEVSVHTAAMEERLKQLAERSRDLMEQNLRVQKRLFELETVVDVRALTMMRAHAGAGVGVEEERFDPLEMDQYNELHSTAHALVEEANDARMLSQNISEDIAQLTGMQTRQQLLSRDLQHLVIGTRMAEVGTLESRLQRNIRTTCQATSKMAVLHFEGGGTLIDSDVLNKLAEPLLHLLRNAVDHGLETPNERKKLGKSEVGTIALEFSRQGQQVVLVCQDDGRGLDLVAIRARAVERGLMKPEQVMSDDELAKMIMHSGFSTRENVSEVSGRGVGMDVVRSWVEGMNGTISLQTELGQGTRVEMRFAASMSTLQSLVVEVTEQRFALPSLNIEQAVPRGVGTFTQVGNSLQYQHENRVLRAVRLAELTGLPYDPNVPLANYDAVLVRVQDKTYALAVDELVDSRELLVKDPGRYARHIAGVAGLSVLGDGSIAVHVDLVQLLGNWQGGSGVVVASKTISHTDLAKPKLPGVLVVDDALTVRNTLQQLIEDAGFYVETARDGMDAVNILRNFTPRVVLTDMEMPNMNGVELTASLRNQAATKDLPIIMITSRSQEKHRELAKQAGVSAYITKPYNEGDLLKVIRSSVGT